MLVDIDIVILEQFFLDFNKKIAFIGSCSYLFDLDIKIFYASI